MKISFPNCGSSAGISIRAAINALLNWHKAERTQTAARKKNVPQITPGWDYRPREQFGDARLSTRHERKLPRP
jgi:hypothetical protein